MCPLPLAHSPSLLGLPVEARLALEHEERAMAARVTQARVEEARSLVAAHAAEAERHAAATAWAELGPHVEARQPPPHGCSHAPSTQRIQ